DNEELQEMDRVKWSIIVSKELADQVNAACERCRRKLSPLVRQIVEDHIDEYLEPAERGPDDENVPTCVAVELNVELVRALMMVGEWWGLGLNAMLRLLVTEHAGAFIRKTKKQQEQVQRFLSPSSPSEGQQ